MAQGAATPVTACEQMAGALVAMNPPPKDRKQQQREWNRRYYERNRDRWTYLRPIRTLTALADLFKVNP